MISISDSIIIVPVGLSPAPSYRIIKSLSEDFSQIFVVGSEKSLSSAKNISQIDGFKNIHATTFQKLELEKYSKHDCKIGFYVGPGTTEMSLGIWSNIIEACGRFPELYVYHSRRSKGGNIIGKEHIINLKSNKKYFLPEVTLNEISTVYNIEKDEIERDSLSWNYNTCKFTYNVRIDEAIKEMSNLAAKKWHEEVISNVIRLKEKYGTHSLTLKRDLLPPYPRYWINIAYRLNDHGIKGGFLRKEAKK